MPFWNPRQKGKISTDDCPTSTAHWTQNGVSGTSECREREGLEMGELEVILGETFRREQ